MSGQSDKDVQLARAAATGDRTAFAALLRQLTPRFAAVIRAQNIPASDVEDVLQETALSLWRALGEYDAGRPFAPWAVMNAANKARDWRRRRRVRAFWLAAAPLEAAGEAADPSASPETQALNARALAHARAAIANLPEPLRGPLLLTAVAGFSQVEAAAALGISAKAVETRVARARAALAIQIEKD